MWGRKGVRPYSFIPKTVGPAGLPRRGRKGSKVPFDTNRLVHIHFLISHQGTILFLKQAICEQGKVLFSHLCDLELEALILLISSESLPHFPPLQTGTISNTHTHLPRWGRRGEGRW